MNQLNTLTPAHFLFQVFFANEKVANYETTATTYTDAVRNLQYFFGSEKTPPQYKPIIFKLLNVNFQA